MIRYIYFLFSILLSIPLWSQNIQEINLVFDEEIEWTKLDQNLFPEEFAEYFPWTFEQCEYIGKDEKRYPVQTIRHDLPSQGVLSTQIHVIESIELEGVNPEWHTRLDSIWLVKSKISMQGMNAYGNHQISPVISRDGKILALQSFRLEIKWHEASGSASRNGEYTMFSALMDGSIYKIPVSQSGVYRIDRSYLEEQGIDVNDINPNNIQLFSNYGNPLPESLLEERIDDLQEIPLLMRAGTDASFDEGDHFLFYVQGTKSWEYNNEKNSYQFSTNIYADNNYLFLKIDGEDGLRIQTNSSVDNADYYADQTDHLLAHELEKVNLLAQYDHTEGTGQVWYGESFFTSKEQDFISQFDFSAMIPGEPVYIYAKLAARNGSSSLFKMEVNDQLYSTVINNVSLDSPELQYARDGIIEKEHIFNEKISKIKISTNAYQAWLDKIVLVVRTKNQMTQSPLFLRDRRSLQHEIAGFDILNDGGELIIWDISEPLSPKEQKYSTTQNVSSFSYEVNGLKEFVAFDPDDIGLIPGQAVAIENQNLHELFDPEMVIIYHPDFLEGAEKLAQHRRNFNAFSVETVDIHQLFNEFSGGKQDPTAIRDFAKMLYDRNPDFKYLLLFGDGSYDYRSIMNTSNNDNFIPVYETKQSLNPISGYVSDDYFALLSDGEGADLEGDMDIALGRIPVRNSQQANILVEKIIDYETSPDNDGDWQNRIALIADDEDFSRHLDQTETIAQYVSNKYPDFNLEKIYLDAFQQEVHPGGHRYPEVNKSINDNIFKGVLAMTYIGHGGPSGFAQERILKLEDIYSWNNENRLPLLITATCSFAGFDDPAINTAGEATILKESGGVIGLLSTVRLVYSGENSRLMNAVFDEIFQKYDGNYLKLGEIIQFAKNKIANKDNKRKFFLFGDPAMQLAIPEHKVYTTHINDKLLQEGEMFQDTLHALSKVRIKGYIGDENGNIMTDFNGIVYPTVFDKAQMIETLENDTRSPKRSFQAQKQVLFKGSATVTNGIFSFEFIIPKDIDYSFGQGKISYYYSNGDNKDGAGSFNSFIVGGSSDELIDDNEGPEITLYMNHTGFESGGITNNRPLLLAYIHDESGINISGTSIGHDLNGILDEDINQQYKLNDFFVSNTDDFQSGVITFPLKKLSPGKHLISVEAWDILNNKGEASIEFVVADEEDQMIKNLYVYPNPVSGDCKFHFEHTLPDTELDINLRIFDLSGRLVKSIENKTFTDGHSVNSIEWNGLDEIGNRISNGIYVFNVEVVSAVLGISLESEYEKLVVIK